MREDEDLPEVLQEFKHTLHHSIFTALPGNVKSFDPATGRVDVTAGVRRALPDEDGDIVHEELSVYPNVRVAWPGAGGFELRFPLVAGDAGLLVWSQWADAQWEETGKPSDPGDLAMHGDGYPKFFPFNRVSPSAFDGTHVLTPTPLVVGGPAAQFVALANLVDARITALQAAFDAHTHLHNPGPGSPTPTGPAVPLAGAQASVAATKLKST